MITYDDDNVTFFFHNGESRSYRRTESERSLDLDNIIEPMRATAWMRRVDDAMFANYYDPCLDR